VAQVLFVLLAPTVIRMVLRKLNPNIGATIELLGGTLLGAAAILFPGIHLDSAQLPAAGQHPLVRILAAIGLGVFGMALGYVLARALKQDPNRSCAPSPWKPVSRMAPWRC